MSKKMAFCILLSVFLIIPVRCSMMDDDETTEEKAIDLFMFNCIAVICCDLKRMDELEKICDTITPLMQKICLTSYGNCIGLEADKEIFFRTFDDEVCPLPKSERRACFKEFMIDIEKHMENVCYEQFDETECKAIESATAQLEKTIQNYTEHGHCYSAADMADETAHDLSKEKGYKKEEVKGMNPERPF